MAAAPRRMWLPHGSLTHRPTVVPTAPHTSGCAGACSHVFPSPTLSQGRTAFPAPGCHSSFPFCSKTLAKPLSRMWGVPPHSCLTMGYVCAPTEPPSHGTATCSGAARGDSPGSGTQASGWAAGWHNQLIPVLVMLPRGGLLSPLTEAVGPWLVAMGTQRSCGSWQQGGLAFTRAGNLSPLVVTNPCCKRGWVGGHG